MKPAAWLALLAGLFVGAAAADAAAEDHGHFFVYVGSGTATSEMSVVPRIQLPANAMLVHSGGGGEAALGTRLGIGTDIGAFARTGGPGRLASLSGGAFYHLIAQHRSRLDPYLSAGYGWFVRQTADRLGAPNLGLGLDYWLSGSRAGLKLEFRRTIRGGPDHLNYREVRVGVNLWQ